MSNNENIADIVAEMRALADDIEAGRAIVGQTVWRNYSDRIEAAWKRERDKLIYSFDPTRAGKSEAPDPSAYAIEGFKAEAKREATAKKSLGVGNAAKLRETLVKLRENLHVEKIDGCACGPTYIGPTVCASELIDTALAEPPRECDVGTAEDQYDRLGRFCRYRNAPLSQNRSCFGCPVYDAMRNCKSTCELIWAQMPYEGGAK